ncbi:Protein with similarity to mammalian ELMO [Homalodisca vitripennis]|nr:Protein with similarity to mammalian ELMO [Homalodisca vitripennis]
MLIRRKTASCPHSSFSEYHHVLRLHHLRESPKGDLSGASHGEIEPTGIPYRVSWGDSQESTKVEFCVGDRFYLCENKILCEYDYEERLVFANMAYNPPSIAQLKRHTSHLPNTLAGLRWPDVEVCVVFTARLYVYISFMGEMRYQAALPPVETIRPVILNELSPFLRQIKIDAAQRPETMKETLATATKPRRMNISQRIINGGTETPTSITDHGQETAIVASGNRQEGSRQHSFKRFRYRPEQSERLGVISKLLEIATPSPPLTEQYFNFTLSPAINLGEMHSVCSLAEPPGRRGKGNGWASTVAVPRIT